MAKATGMYAIWRLSVLVYLLDLSGGESLSSRGCFVDMKGLNERPKIL